MTISADVLRTHIAYSGWATGRLLESLAELTPEERIFDFQTADRSPLGTMVHIYRAELLWLARFHQHPQPDLPSADMPLAQLQVDSAALQLRMEQWAATLTDASVQEDLSYRNMRGDPFTQPIWQLVLHVVNHATHHRGQVAGFLRSLGHKPPVLDLVFYYRQSIQ
jgi:uncharacterized damage-inducible protein DinB